jgi:hypothetical protein
LKHCAYPPNDLSAEISRSQPGSHRAVAVLTSYRASFNPKPKLQIQSSVALLKHRPAFLRPDATGTGPKANPNASEPQGPAACASLPSITMSKNQSTQNHPTQTPRSHSGLVAPNDCTEVDKAGRPLGAALGESYIGASRPGSQAGSENIRFPPLGIEP